jgi:hypothetical protein
MLTPKFISSKCLLTPKSLHIIKIAFPKTTGADTHARPYDVHFVTNYFTTQPRAGTL